MRGQLSTYEQLMLFNNSLSCLGIQWEFGSENNFYITKYNLIKNIPKMLVSQHIIINSIFPLIPFEGRKFLAKEERKMFLQKRMPNEKIV